jgi:hypothetical protein
MLLEHRPAANGERAPEQRRGFALLLVFALAASVAILIYLEIPRVAFERQRDKEALLIDRGEQYARAIELYGRKMNRRPQTLDDLEKAQTIRFLRRRYKDPMTGKDEWRLIHMGPNGQYLDSKVHKPGGALDKQDSGPGVLASKIQGIGQSATIISQDGQGVSAALQKRASDRISPGSTAGAGSGDAGQNGTDASQDPSQQPPNAAQPGQPGAPMPGGSANAARFPFPAQQNVDPQQQGNTQNPATPTLGSVLPPGQQDATGNNPSLAGPSQPQAMQAIQSILGAQQRTTPAGGSGAQAGTGAGMGVGGGAALGPGLAGVATTVEMEGIRRYKDHSNYSEWEFIYDPNESNAQGQGVGTQQPGVAGNAGSNAAGSSFGGMAGGLPAPPGNPPRN